MPIELPEGVWWLKKGMDEDLDRQVVGKAEDIIDAIKNRKFDQFFENVLETSRKQRAMEEKWETTGYEFLLGYGGPNIWFNTWDCEIEGYWGGNESRVKLPRDVCDAIDDYLNDIYGGS